jgi:hypothetical protein
MSVYKVLINLLYIDCVKQRERDTYKGNGTSHLKSIFATETTRVQMTNVTK